MTSIEQLASAPAAGTPREPEKPNAEYQANVFSKLTYYFMGPLLSIGAKRPLQQEDLTALYPGDDSETCLRLFNHQFEIARRKQRETGKEPALFWVLMRAFASDWYWSAFAYALYSATQFLPPLILSVIVKHLQGAVDGQLSDAELWLSIVSLLVVPMIGSLAFNWHNQYMGRVGYRARSAMTAAIFHKALKLSSASRSATSVGVIMNIMQGDAHKITVLTPLIHGLWASPIQIIITLWLIYNQVQVAMFVGLGFLLFQLPLQGFFMAILLKNTTEYKKQADSRMKLISDTLSGIRIVKMYGWEDAFAARIQDLRKLEVRFLKRVSDSIAYGLLFVFSVAPYIMNILVFVTFVVGTDKILDPATAFTTIALFQLMQIPFGFLPIIINSYADNSVAMTRITTFLDLGELDPPQIEQVPSGVSDSSAANAPMRTLVMFGPEQDPTPMPQDVAIRVTNADFVWKVDESALKLKAMASRGRGRGRGRGGASGRGRGKGAAQETAVELADIESGPASPSAAGADEKTSGFSIQGVNITIPKGKLVAVVGSVGSGKSSLMNALLGEMNQSSGRITIDGSISYAAQEPWILNRTLKDNITFDVKENPDPVDEDRYARVIDVCALKPDLKQLGLTLAPEGSTDDEIERVGEKTEIGERGINLSGGQRARVALARTTYTTADTYIFDDPLSAVDSHVAKHIFHKCFAGFLAGKTRVLVTNQPEFLNDVDHIIVMSHGRVAEQGTMAELMEHKSEFAKLMRKYGEAKSSKETTQAKADLATIDAPVATTDEKKEGAVDKTKLIEAEDRNEGSVTWRNYVFYFAAAGWDLVIPLLLLYCAVEAATLGASFWLTDWTTNYTDQMILAYRYSDANSVALGLPPGGCTNLDCVNDVINTPGFQASPHVSETDINNNMYIWIGWGMAGALLTLIRSGMFSCARINASSHLHALMLRRVLGAPLSYFDKTPLGRLLSRFSRDMEQVDTLLPMAFGQFTSTFCRLVSLLIGMSISTKGIFLVGLVPLGLFYGWVQRFYRSTSTELQRIVSITKSPIYAQFSEVLAGLTSVRAARASTYFAKENMLAVDTNQKSEFTLIPLAQWLALRLDLMGASCSFVVAIIAVTRPDLISPQWAALSLTYAIGMPQSLKFCVRTIADLEGRMVSIERVQALIGLEEQEAKTPLLADGTSESDVNLPADWPNKGKIEIQNLWIEYKKDLPVLKDLTLTINEMEKIGVAGRTGSGKSTLMLALLRLVEPTVAKPGQPQGRILIDGVDISTISLKSLRTRVAIVPQQPVLFCASVRRNLDPFDSPHITDDMVWDALRKVELDKYVQSLATVDEQGNAVSGLAHKVEEGGSNFSVGQRQLLCIARALLRKPKLLLLDEATASIDVASDDLVQFMIRANFKDTTCVTIAHRLKTIMDSDRILLLERGQLREFAPPAKLLAYGSGNVDSVPSKTASTDLVDGSVYHMAMEPGPVVFEMFRRIATGEEKFAFSHPVVRSASLGSAAESPLPPGWEEADWPSPLPGAPMLKLYVNRERQITQWTRPLF